MKNPFKFLPTFKVDHTQDNIFNALTVPEENVVKCMKVYYEKVADAIENGKLEGIHRIPESFVLEFLMNYNYSSLNEMVACIGKIYGTLSKGNQFDPNTAERFLGRDRAHRIVGKGIKDMVDSVPGVSEEKAERLKELLTLAEDPEYMRSLPHKDAMNIIKELIQIKDSLRK